MLAFSKTTIVSLFIFLTIGCDRKCEPINEYEFLPTTEEIEVKIGATYDLEFRFSPNTPRKMEFHSQLEDNIHITLLFEKIERKKVFSRSDRSSSTFIKEYSKTSPFIISIPFTVRKGERDYVYYDFGKLGKIKIEPARDLILSISLHPATFCYLDSSEGFSSESITMKVRL